MESHVLTIILRRGFSLVEIALLMSVAVIIMSAGFSMAASTLDEARARRTLNDMSAILVAGEQFNASCGVWPAAIEDEKKFLSTVPEHNAWGGAYTVAHSDARFWVETRVPKGTKIPSGPWPFLMRMSSQGNELWRMGRPVSYGATARLIYEN
jgi:type II secretory pathway pseudopilin PulG